MPSNPFCVLCLSGEHVPSSHEVDPGLVEARRALKTSRAEQHIAALLAKAPPLSEETRRRLAALLGPPVQQQPPDSTEAGKLTTPPEELG